MTCFRSGEEAKRKQDALKGGQIINTHNNAKLSNQA